MRNARPMYQLFRGVVSKKNKIRIYKDLDVITYTTRVEVYSVCYDYYCLEEHILCCSAGIFTIEIYTSQITFTNDF